MSAQPDSETLDGAAYSPYNWYGEVDDDRPTPGQDSNSPGTSRARFLGHGALKKSGTLLCGESLKWFATKDEDELKAGNFLESLELTDPTAYPPYENVGENRHGRRVNEETGFMNWGEDTFVAIADRPADQLMAVVDLVLMGPTGRDLPGKTREQIRSEALRLKRHDDSTHDTEIVEDVVRWIDNPGLLDA